MLRKLSLCFVLFFALALLVGCGDFDLENAKSKLEEEGYTVVSIEGDAAEQYVSVEDGKVVGALTATKSESFLNHTVVIIIKYEEAKSAKAAAEKLDGDNAIIKYYTKVSKNALIMSTDEEALKAVTGLF